MNAELIRLLNRIVRSGLATALAVSGLQAQTTVHLRSQAREVDFSQASTTKPAKTGNTLPPSCSVGELFLHMGQAPGKNLFVCTAVNTWTAHSAQVDIPSPGGQNQMMLTSSGGTLVWDTFQGDVQGGLTEIKVRAIQGQGIASTTPVNDDVLKWDDAAKAWTPLPNIPLLQPGTGISVFGNQVQVDSLLIPTYSSGTGAPTSQCAPGRDLFVDTIDNALYYCSGSGWSRVATQDEINSTFASNATSFAPTDHTHPASQIHGVMQAAQGGLGANSESFSGVLRMSAGEASVVSGAAHDCVLVDGTSVPCSTGGAGNVRTDQGNTYTDGDQNFSGAGSLRLPAATPMVPGGGDLWYESTTGGLKYYDQSGSTNRSIAFVPSAGIVASNNSVLTPRTILGIANKIDVINGDGSSGNPTFTAGSDIVDKTKPTTYAAGAKQTFVASPTYAGASLACSALPASPANGDLTCDSEDSNRVKVYSNGAWVTVNAGSGGTPGGSGTHVQYNSNGTFAGDSGLTYDSTTKTLAVGGTAEGSIRLREESANGTNYIGWSGALSRSTNTLLRLPDTDPSAGQYLLFGASSGGISSGMWVTPSYQTVRTSGTNQTQRGTLELEGGTNVTISATDDNANNRTVVTVNAGGITAIADEGTALTARATVNFTGSGVVCADNSGASRTDCTVSGGGAGGSSIAIEDEGIALTARPTLNLIGAGVTCVDNAGATKTDCTIPGATGGGTQTVGAVFVSVPTLWNSNGTRYTYPFATAAVVAADNAGTPLTMRSPFAGKLTKLRVNCSIAPVGAALTYTIRVAQTDTSLTCVVGDGALGCVNLTDQPTVAEGDQISIKGVMTGATTGGTCGSSFGLIPQ